jgi:general secretion pathway protein E
MQLLNNELYLLDLLGKAQMISPDQKKMILTGMETQRQKLIRAQQGKKGVSLKEIRDNIELIDIILSFKLELPGKKGVSLSEEMIVRAVAADRKMPFKKLDPLELDLDVVTKTIPQSFALKHLILPFAVKNGVLHVAMYEPGNVIVLEEVERANQIKVKPYLSTRTDIRRMLAEFFGFQSSISAAETQIASPMVDLSNLEQYVKISSSKEIASSDRNIKAAVEHLFNYAFDERASDIHIEPKRNVSRVRLRIDGVLHTIYELPKVVHQAIISRIKSLSRLDIAEKRRPQDGRIKVEHEGIESEIRVSTIPVAFGEKVVMRILSSSVIFQDISKIGFSNRDFGIYKTFFESPHGIILITGPTGSGKSTTLYSTLKHVSSEEINIVTVEDPVEMVHDDFNQIAVQPQVDVTFASILRNILRQDPDIIMIGEIRDLDTAANAIQAALTGHLVFSTLHTNDAVSSISRLIDLGVQPFMVSSTLLGAMAQRLVRTICPHCVTTMAVKTSLLTSLGFPVEANGEIKLRKGTGCRKCRGTGYLGRCGIFEIFPMSNKLKVMVNQGVSIKEIEKQTINEGMTTLRQDAWNKVKNGVTTYEEAMRVCGGS